jgi:hypothetical protein
MIVNYVIGRVELGERQVGTVLRSVGRASKMQRFFGWLDRPCHGYVYADINVAIYREMKRASYGRGG